MRNAAEAIPGDKRERLRRVVLQRARSDGQRLGGRGKSKIPAKGFRLRSTAHLIPFLHQGHRPRSGSPSLIAVITQHGGTLKRGESGRGGAVLTVADVEFNGTP